MTAAAVVTRTRATDGVGKVEALCQKSGQTYRRCRSSSLAVYQCDLPESKWNGATAAE